MPPSVPQTTNEFSLLPLHAASPLRKSQKGVSDLYTSSYTSTLTALIHAKRPSPLAADSANEKRRLITIGRATAQGTGKLFSISTELANIGQPVDSYAMYTRIEGEESCISIVTDELLRNEWVHIACHSIPNKKQPLESAFALYDGPFTVQRIIHRNLENPEFAYLSAFCTTVGDDESLDDIHLDTIYRISFSYWDDVGGG